MFRIFENRETGVKVTTRVNNAQGEKSRLTKNNGKRDKIINNISTLNQTLQPVDEETRERMVMNPKFFDEKMQNYIGSLNRGRQRNNGNKNSFELLPISGKLEKLVRLAHSGEVREILDKLTIEMITNATDSPRFCDFYIDRIALKKLSLPDNIIDKIQAEADKFMPMLYRDLGMRGNGAYLQLKDALTKGRKSFEIIVDNDENPTRVVKVVEIPIENSYEDINQDGEIVFVTQNLNTNITNSLKHAKNNRKEIPYQKVVNIDWSKNNVTKHISYVHGLMKAANRLRIIEETMIVWYVTNSTYRTVHTVPTQHLGGAMAAQVVSKQKELYTTNFDYNGTTGELHINDEANIPFERATFIADGDFGAPKTDVLNNRSTPIDKIESQEFFERKLYRESGLPASIWDRQGGSYSSLEPSRAQREEVYFNGLLDQIRNWYGELFLKPFHLHLGYAIPELNSDVSVFENVRLKFNSVNQFKAMLDIEVETLKIEKIEKIIRASKFDTGDGDYYALPPNYLFEKMLGYTKEDMKIIQDFRNEWQTSLNNHRKEQAEINKEFGFDEEDGGGGGRRR